MSFTLVRDDDMRPFFIQGSHMIKRGFIVVVFVGKCVSIILAYLLHKFRHNIFISLQGDTDTSIGNWIYFTNNGMIVGIFNKYGFKLAVIFWRFLLM